MEITFRKAVPQDLDAVLQLYKLAVAHMNSNDIYQWNEKYPNRQVISDDIRKGDLYLGLSGDMIVSAYALNRNAYDETREVKWQYPDANYRIIHRLCVDPRLQGSGIGTLTMRHIEESLSNIGVEALRLDTASNNAPAMGLYGKLGYKIVGEVAWDSGTAYFFEKRL